MKVPTYHKFGLTKAGVKRSELRDRKISDILTHHLTIGIGSVLGVLVYILNYSRVQPSNVIQAIMQVFLFASIGVLCVGVPAVLFKLAEMFYFKYISPRSEEKQSIMKYEEERDEFDFWKLRRDYSFWRVLDGLSFEREVMNLLMHLGYLPIDENPSCNRFITTIMTNEEKKYYIAFHTSSEMNSTLISELCSSLEVAEHDTLMIFSQRGFKNKSFQLEESENIQLYDINKIIKLSRDLRLK